MGRQRTTRVLASWTMVALVLLFAGRASAQPAETDEVAVTGLVGAHLRTDLGTQLVRAAATAVVGRLGLHVVLDPKGYYEGAQHDSDIVAEWTLHEDGWAVLGGWRLSSLPVLGTRYYQEKVLFGASAPVPILLFGFCHVRVGGELAMTLVRHGDGIPTFWAWEDDRLRGSWVNVGLFARFQLGARR